MVERIVKASSLVCTSSLQKQVASKLREYFPDLQEEKFVGLFPVDIYINKVAIVQVDGPRHFLFNLQREGKTPTPKDLLRRATLPADIPGIHVAFDEWEQAVSTNSIDQSLHEKFAAVGCHLRDRASNTQEMTFSYSTPIPAEVPCVEEAEEEYKEVKPKKTRKSAALRAG